MWQRMSPNFIQIYLSSSHLNLDFFSQRIHFAKYKVVSRDNKNSLEEMKPSRLMADVNLYDGVTFASPLYRKFIYSKTYVCLFCPIATKDKMMPIKGAKDFLEYWEKANYASSRKLNPSKDTKIRRCVLHLDIDHNFIICYLLTFTVHYPKVEHHQ